MYNRIIILGNLTRDIEMRYTQGGSAIGNTGIATTKKFKSATGEQREDTLFVDLTFFGRTAEIANQYLRKGSKVLVEGRLKFDQWTAQDGSKRSKHSVVVESLQMLDTKGSNNTAEDSAPHAQQGGQPQPSGGYATPPQNYQNTQPQNTSPSTQATPHNGTQPANTPPFPNMADVDDEIPF